MPHQKRSIRLTKKANTKRCGTMKKMWKTPKDGKIKDKMIKKEGKRYRKSASITKKSMAMRKEDKCFEKKSLSEKIQPMKRGPGAHSEKR